MLRVRIFSLRETIVKLILWISIVVFVYCILIFIIKIFKVESRAFATNIVENNINYDFKKERIYLKVLKNELGINTILKPKGDTKNMDVPSTYVKENNVPEKYIQDKYISNFGVKGWNRPKNYFINQFSTGKIQVGNTLITNYTNRDLDLSELSKVSNFKINDNLKILIVHTHTSEAYSEIGSGTNFRTLDDSLNVVSVGDVLEKNLLLKNFNVKHSKVKHDTPSYNGSYGASLKTVEEELIKNDYDIILDIHRDALASNMNFRPTAEINGESVAKLMFVVGTNASGLSHDNWMENLKLALLIQNTANEMYPGLFRDLNLSKSRYNQHVCNGALILEVGATGNTLDEVWNAMKYFSNVLEVLKL